MLYRKMLISKSSGFGIQCFFISNQIYGGKLYSEIKRSEFRYAQLEIQRNEQSSAALYKKVLMSWSSGYGILFSLYQIKAKEASFILRFKHLNFQMQSQSYEENVRVVSERSQKQSSKTLCREMLNIPAIQGDQLYSEIKRSEFRYFLYRIKARETSLIPRLKDLNFNMHTQRQKENCKKISE